MTAGTNQPETWSARRWIGARLRWASATICTMRASIVSLPTFSARITSAPVPLIVPPITGAPASFATGIDSPVTIDSSTELRPSITPIDRDLLARTDAQTIPDLDRVERDLLLAPVRADAPRRLRREIEEGADAPPVASRARSSSTCPRSTRTVMTAAASK